MQRYFRKDWNPHLIKTAPSSNPVHVKAASNAPAGTQLLTSAESDYVRLLIKPEATRFLSGFKILKAMNKMTAWQKLSDVSEELPILTAQKAYSSAILHGVTFQNTVTFDTRDVTRTSVSQPALTLIMASGAHTSGDEKSMGKQHVSGNSSGYKKFCKIRTLSGQNVFIIDQFYCSFTTIKRAQSFQTLIKC